MDIADLCLVVAFHPIKTISRLVQRMEQVKHIKIVSVEGENIVIFLLS